ncbi:hypothetical protein BZG36_01104 [Bifiguratus adelaidae]|uniref:GH16 domain-containing protein n=1 Tax=Bifiguratus adelaidae TaxID=1938954 RepID=A0A261Y623_9FUNG|nr:hypothetical protein BZG36_01104 [Bifiguratus adelaidae]
MRAFVIAVAVLLGALATAEAQYTLQTEYSGNTFFNGFTFFTGSDPTHGFVDYVDASTASSQGLTQVRNGVVYIFADNTTVASSAGRRSVRITSNQSYNSGLFLFDVNHVPFGCGTWPALWTVGPNWPNSGEIDIFEGVNTQATDLMTLHTQQGCTMPASRSQTGTTVTSNCWINAPGQSSNQGCGVTNTQPTSYGDNLNNAGGGVYATLWNSNGISIWWFQRSAIPSDIRRTPDANFPFGSNCPSSFFVNHQIVVDLTFCGDWAGNVYSQFNCPGSSCQNYVQYNPSAFSDAYWSINSFKVYQPGTPTTTTSTSKTTTTTKATTTSTTATSSPTSTLVCNAANNGYYYCMNSGVSQAYEICNNGAWVSGACGPGTVCWTSGNSIVCNYP